jgi:N-acyl-D-amino-acid deacylase
MDLIIRGGQLIDGTGTAAVHADVGIADGKIAAVGALADKAETPVIDATGLTVAPGFIDIHSHSDYTLYVDPRAVSSVMQGVTTEVLGNCGHGCAPIFDPALASVNIYGYDPERGLSWQTMAEYLSAIEERRPAVNVTSLVANGNLRLATTGIVDRPANADELSGMKRLLEQALEQGGIGYSTGLEYTVERGCSEHEIAELCRVAAGAGGFYATHTRNLYGQAREAIEEPIRAGREAGLPVQISHISVLARLADDSQRAIYEGLELVEGARKQGLDVTFDMHTRMFGTTNLSAILPAWALEGKLAEIEARLRTPSVRAEMRKNPSIIFALARGDWRRIVIFDSRRQPEISRRSIAEIAASRDQDPVDTVYDILLGEIEDLHGLMVIAHAYEPEDLRSVFMHPLCMVGSDATALALDGPLAGKSFHGAFTWAGWFFHHFVTETKRLSPEQAIHRMTGLPASRLGWKDRGVVRKGAWADLAIFDAEKFAEKGTTFEPNQTAEGMRNVLVNGIPTVRDGRLTGDRSGQVLRG